MLSDEQQQVVDSIDHFIFLLAGAGSGKTRVIVEKIKKCLEQGVSADKILAITFTKKASHEMMERIGDSGIYVHTFHQLAYQTLKNDLNLKFHLIEDNELTNYTDKELLAITNYKNSMYQSKRPRVFKRYQNELKQRNALDFDDLLHVLLEHLKKHQIRFNFDYIFVDEFQDTNQLQYHLLLEMRKKETKIFAVGDPDQSIYMFRGATPHIINQYIKSFDAAVYKLTYNYRSDINIIHTANRLIKQNRRDYEKNLISVSKACGSVYAIKFVDALSEAVGVVNILKHYQKAGVKLHEMVILYRNHNRAYSVIQELHQKGVSFCLEDDEIRDLNGVRMLTIHQAKGLEFDLVILIGCENEILPARRDNRFQLFEEERRLMFVGTTRARHFLFFTYREFDEENHHFTSSIFLRKSGLKTIAQHKFSDIISLGDEDGHQKQN